MNFANISLFIELIVVALLSAVIFFTLRLNKHFQMLQKNRAELARQLSGFAHSTERAEAAIQQVRLSTNESAQQMEELLQRAEMLKQDLGYLVDRGNGLADRLEGGIRQGRDPDADGASSRRSRRSSSTSARATSDEALVSSARRTARRTSKEALQSDEASQTTAAAEANSNTDQSSLRRRRRTGAAEKTTPAQAGTQASSEAKSASQKNSELLKVLQGMR